MSDTDKTILIVDDEAELLEMVRAIFTGRDTAGC